jgi:hypothetical protein
MLYRAFKSSVKRDNLSNFDRRLGIEVSVSSWTTSSFLKKTNGKCKKMLKILVLKFLQTENLCFDKDELRVRNFVGS